MAFLIDGMDYDAYKTYMKNNCIDHSKTFDRNKYQNTFLDISYEDKLESCLLDIYLPENSATESNSPYPVIIYIHGGGMMLGNKACNEHPLRALKKGYAVVMVEYSLVWERVFPTQVMQVKRAIHWVKKHALQYGLDAKHIGLMGESAGGHLAAFCAVTSASENWGDKGIDSTVQAVVIDFAPIDFYHINNQIKQLNRPIPQGNMAPHNSVSLYLGGFMQEDPELAYRTNPDIYINDKCPPFYIQHGIEHELPYLQAVSFAQVLENNIGKEKVFLSLLPCVAGGDDPKYFTDENINKEIQFFDKYLKGSNYEPMGR